MTRFLFGIDCYALPIAASGLGLSKPWGLRPGDKAIIGCLNGTKDVTFHLFFMIKRSICVLFFCMNYFIIGSWAGLQTSRGGGQCFPILYKKIPSFGVLPRMHIACCIFLKKNVAI